MATPQNSPLTDDHLQQIRAALKQIDVAESQILLAKQAGVDVGHLEQQLMESKTRLRALKNTYFPGSI
jgi:hypothetical protein